MSVRSQILAANHNTAERDAIVMRAVQEGRIPSWVKSGWTSLTTVDSIGNKLELFFMRDALAILDDDESLLYIPPSIATAQAIADHLGAVILTPKLADLVFHDSRTQRVPFQGIPGLFKDPKKASQDEQYMQSSEAMLFHSDSINAKIDRSAPLVMGHSKLIAIGPNLNHLGIYGGYGGTVHGWAIQSYPGPHDANWVDYSQLLNLVSLDAVYNGSKVSLSKDVFERADRVGLVSYEGVPFTPRWPTNGGSSGSGGAKSPGTSTTTPGGATGGGRRLLDRSNVGGPANLAEALFTSIALPVLGALATWGKSK